MAGDWIKMRNDLSDDPAVIGVAARLGLDEFSVVGRLHRLWSWADRQSRDGHAAGVTSAWLDRYIQCDGFAQALVDVGWLVIDERGMSIPNFGRHNGESAKTRCLAASRKQKQRSLTEDCDDGMSRTERDKRVTREEKRREESSSLRSEDETRVSALTVDELVMDGLTAQTAAEFLAHRKRLKAPLTLRAWSGIRAQASKAGWSAEQAVCKALERGWRGFEADWVQDGGLAQEQKPRETAYQQSMRERAEQMTGGIASAKLPGARTQRSIDAEVFDVTPKAIR